MLTSSTLRRQRRLHASRCLMHANMVSRVWLTGSKSLPSRHLLGCCHQCPVRIGMRGIPGLYFRHSHLHMRMQSRQFHVCTAVGNPLRAVLCRSTSGGSAQPPSYILEVRLAGWLPPVDTSGYPRGSPKHMSIACRSETVYALMRACACQRHSAIVPRGHLSSPVTLLQSQPWVREQRARKA